MLFFQRFIGNHQLSSLGYLPLFPKYFCLIALKTAPLAGNNGVLIRRVRTLIGAPQRQRYYHYAK
jgi:hypothetical protein